MTCARRFVPNAAFSELNFLPWVDEVYQSSLERGISSQLRRGKDLVLFLRLSARDEKKPGGRDMKEETAYEMCAVYFIFITCHYISSKGSFYNH